MRTSRAAPGSNFDALTHDHHQAAGAAVLDAVEKFLRHIGIQVGLALPRIAEATPDSLMVILEIHRRRRDAFPHMTHSRYVARPVVVRNRLPELAVRIVQVNPIAEP